MFKFIQGVNRRLSRHKALIQRYKNEDTVFVYQMGKVGSTSLEKTIPNAIHVHAFYNANHTCPVRLKGLAKFGVKHFIYRLEQELMAYLLRRAFRSRRNTKIVTLVRNPQARNISMFFHDLDAYLFSAHTNCVNSRKAPLATRNQNPEILKEIFETEFDHDYPLNWFDREFKAMTGIDVYQYSFDKEKGYAHIKSGTFDVLCLRTNVLNNSVELLSEFLSEGVTLVSENTAEQKWYSSAYAEFKANYQYPKEMTDKIETSPFFKHFFRLSNRK